MPGLQLACGAVIVPKGITTEPARPLHFDLVLIQICIYDEELLQTFDTGCGVYLIPEATARRCSVPAGAVSETTFCGWAAGCDNQ